MHWLEALLLGARLLELLLPLRLLLLLPAHNMSAAGGEQIPRAGWRTRIGLPSICMCRRILIVAYAVMGLILDPPP